MKVINVSLFIKISFLLLLIYEKTYSCNNELDGFNKYEINGNVLRAMLLGLDYHKVNKDNEKLRQQKKMKRDSIFFRDMVNEDTLENEKNIKSQEKENGNNGEKGENQSGSESKTKKFDKLQVNETDGNTPIVENEKNENAEFKNGDVLQKTTESGVLNGNYNTYNGNNVGESNNTPIIESEKDKNIQFKNDDVLQKTAEGNVLNRNYNTNNGNIVDEQNSNTFNGSYNIDDKNDALDKHEIGDKNLTDSENKININKSDFSNSNSNVTSLNSPTTSFLLETNKKKASEKDAIKKVTENNNNRNINDAVNVNTIGDNNMDLQTVITNPKTAVTNPKIVTNLKTVTNSKTITNPQTTVTNPQTTVT
ncbi:conserved protein, unknown function, partial [Hepatocystis sp. ex Piliocolobus tephrosceles]